MVSTKERFTDLLRDTRYRRSYSNIMKGSAVVEQSRACCEFLKICQTENVIPNSCKVKINTKPVQSNVIAILRKQNLMEASKKELELAIRVEELATVKARDDLVEDLRKVGEEYSEEKTEVLVAKLNHKMGTQFLHFHNQYKKKFHFLKQKQNQGDGDEDEPATQEWTDGEAAGPGGEALTEHPASGLQTSISSHTGGEALTEHPAPAQQQIAIQLPPAQPAANQRTRRFVKRGKYRRIQRKKLRGQVKLTTNYSDYPLSQAQERALNRGLNFCPQPTTVNKTKVEAGLKRMARSICWADFFQGKDSDGGEVEPVSLIREKKTNFPPTTGENKYVPSRGVKEFITSTHDAIVSAPLKPFHSNLPEDQVAGLKELKKEQDKRRIVIKPNDKMGGQSLMNTVDYVEKVEEMLNATFEDESGEEKR